MHRDAGCDLDQGQAIATHFEHRALGDVAQLAAHARHVGAVERELLHLRHELRNAAFAVDHESPVNTTHGQAVAHQGAHKDHTLRALGDVDEAAHTGHDTTEAADVDVARRVEFGHAEEGDVEAAAVVEVEHRGVVDDGLRVGAGAEAELVGRNAADGARLHRQREVLIALFARHLADACGHAHTQVHDGRAQRAEFEQGAALDDAPRVEWCFLGRRHQRRQRPALQVGRVVEFAESHPVVVHVFGHHQVVDQDAGDAHEVGVQRARRHDALDLRNHHTLAVMRRLRDGQQVLVERLVFGAEVAVFVGRGGADQRHMHGETWVEQLLAPADVDELHDVIGAARREPGATQARVDKGVQPDGRDDADLAASNGAVEMGDDALRQVVGGDGVVLHQLAQARR